jgi:hypothetical protein
MRSHSLFNFCVDKDTAGPIKENNDNALLYAFSLSPDSIPESAGCTFNEDDITATYFTGDEEDHVSGGDHDLPNTNLPVEDGISQFNNTTGGMEHAIDNWTDEFVASPNWRDFTAANQGGVKVDYLGSDHSKELSWVDSYSMIESLDDYLLQTKSIGEDDSDNLVVEPQKAG